MPSLPETATRPAAPTFARLDFPFAERETPEARARIAADLDTIARTVAGADPSLHALVLTGAFSRGEGSIRDDRPVNDYDLLALRRSPGGGARYHDLARSLSERVGIEVDLVPVWRQRLPHVGRKLFWLDVALGGRVLVGDPDALRALPRMGPAGLAPLEVARLLGNRAAGLLLALPGPAAPVDRAQADLQSAKAVIGALDAALLHRGLYAPRLRERLALAAWHRHHETFRRAVEWKLTQAASPVRWEEAAAVLLDAVEETEARAVDDGLVEHLFHAMRARGFRFQPSRAVRHAAWRLVASARFPEGPDVTLARSELRALGRPEGDHWPALKSAFFALRSQTLH